MALLDRRTVSVLSTILIFAGVLALIWLARLPVIAFIFAVFFGKLIEPVVERFERWLHLSWGKALAITYLAIFLALFIFGFTVGPSTVHQVQRLSETLPELFQKIRTGNIALQVGATQGWSAQNQIRIQHWLVEHQETVKTLTEDIKLRLEQLAANLPWVLLVPVLAVFLLKDRSRLRSSAVRLIGASQHRAFFESVLDDLDTMLAEYVRAQLLLCLFAFIAYGVFLLIARLPYAFAVAAIGGILEFIPFVGPLLALATILGIALLTGYSHWFVLVAFWVVWRGVQDYINTPRVMSAGLDLPPLLAIFAILVGGEVAGVLGIFLSIPTIAALRIVWNNWTQLVFVRKAA
jgi:predicted PurR-regulated permease PerM